MSGSSEPIPAPAAKAVDSCTYPMDEFHLGEGRFSGVAAIPSGDLPEPQRSLLDHASDMTSTLEKFHGQPLHIELLRKHRNGDEYFRQVVLVLDHSGKRVEFGAIKIHLNLFEAGARGEILREQQPLGRILASFDIAYTSRPSAFLRLEAGEFIGEALQASAGQTLYGRRNTLFDSAGRPLAEIVEILPP